MKHLAEGSEIARLIRRIQTGKGAERELVARIRAVVRNPIRTVQVAAVAAQFGSSVSIALATEPPRIGFPVDCALGETCFVQNYVDIDPGPEAADFACGFLTYDGHKGVDFRILDLKMMADGVPVLAAAGGQVLRVRDGVRDGFPKDIGEAQIKGKECGNGAVIDLDDGWQMQYCHMREGSIAVEQGQTIAVGDKIGLVGMSGRAEFPHLHFGIRHKKRVVDPYVGLAPAKHCEGPLKPLWTSAALPALQYRTSGLLNAGFTSDKPTMRGIEEGKYHERATSQTSNLIFYVRFFGLREGDRQSFRVTGPRGGTVVEKQFGPAAKNQAQWMQFVGRRAPKNGWPKGTYRAVFQLRRNGNPVIEATRRVEIH